MGDANTALDLGKQMGAELQIGWTREDCELLAESKLLQLF